MKLDYLKWYKDIELKLHGQTDTHLLLSSAIDEPTDLLKKHLKQFADEQFEKRINVPSFWGHEKLIANIAERYNTKEDNILISLGASNAIFLICQALLNNGDHVVIESPVYEPLLASPDFIGAKVTVLSRRPPDFTFDLDEFEKSINADTKLVLITNLHNPSGAFLGNDYLVRLAQIAKSKNENIKILVDEVYRDFVPGQPASAATLDSCFISLNSLTKVYALGIIHCGWTIADTETIKLLRRMHTLVARSGSRLLESFACFIVENLDGYLQRSLKIVSQNRKTLLQLTRPLIDEEVLSGEVPQFGCIYFPKINGVKDTRKLMQSLIDRHKIYTVPGRFFGEPEHIRIGFSTQPERFKNDIQLFAEVLPGLI